ncbi:recombinase family protein [Streptomyces tsukubensis]|uniref:recombinase family protein n=1 Tax=Streptomyces tsukubensis TaxID=83656 RepID=UPI00345097D9
MRTTPARGGLSPTRVTHSSQIQRVLGALRLSVSSDESTSIERQKDEVNHWADSPSREARVIGFAEDTDVSGSMSPWDRPGLGLWLRTLDDLCLVNGCWHVEDEPCMGQWDVLVAWKLDRLSRNTVDFGKLLEWAQKHNKVIVSTQENFDLSTDIGVMVAKIIMIFAEFELKTIASRIKSSMAKLRMKGRWLGGNPPTGYQSVRTTEGVTLVQDPVYGPLVRRIYTMLVVDLMSAGSICKILNAEGILTWSDHMRQQKGRTVKGHRWLPQVLGKMFTSATLCGYVMHDGEIYADAAGKWVKVTEDPILTFAEWDQANKQLMRNAQGVGHKNYRVRDNETAHLSTVTRCGDCWSPMYLSRRRARSGIKVYEHYRCSYGNYGVDCTMRSSIERSELEELFSDQITGQLGSAPELRKIVTPGVDHTAELEACKLRLGKLEGDFIAGKYDSDAKEASYWRTLESLTEEIARLEAIPVTPTTVEWVETGTTFADKWGAMDEEDRRTYLLANNVTLLVFKDAGGKRRHGVVTHFGALQEMAVRAGIKSAEKETWAEAQHQCPVYWSLSEEELARQSAEWEAVMKANYAVEELVLPATLTKLRGRREDLTEAA